MKNKVIQTLTLAGLGWSVPLIRLFSGEDYKQQLKEIWMGIGIPIVAIIFFLFFWAFAAQRIEPVLENFPDLFRYINRG